MGYKSMAARAEKTLEDAVALRYAHVKGELAALDEGSVQDEDKRSALEEEKIKFGSVPEDSEAQKDYFKDWCESQERGNGDGEDRQLNSMLAMLQSGIPPQARQMILSQANKGPAPKPKKVRAKDLDTLKSAMEAHPKLEWDERLAKIADQVGNKLRDDPSDDTSQVTFEQEGFTCWLPTDTLIDEEDTTPEP